MAAVSLSPALRAGWWLHRTLYRVTGGRIGGRLNGFGVILLVTTGRQTGRSRVAALQMLPLDDGWAVAASHAGADAEPGWLLNLRARSDAEVQVGATGHRVRAREATGPEREELWARFVATDTAYAEYQRRTQRVIAVVILEPNLT